MFDRILKVGEGRKLKAVQGLVPDINALEPEIEVLSDEALRARTVEFRQRIDRGEPVDDLLLEAFATVREAARRVIGQRHFDVQLMGGAVLHFGWVAEMKTGEGKTLVSTLPVYLNALTGNGVHVITVNDYLARFHAEWMGRIYEWLGLSVGLTIPDIKGSAEKRANYGCDITYGINNEFGFDYLRDNMAMSTDAKVQRGHAYAIVDEIDSILIDEARTPLIISGRLADAAQLYYTFASVVRGLSRDVDYDVDEEKRHVAPHDDGIEKVEAALGIDNLYDELSSNLVHQLQVALKAKELYKRDRDYIVTNGEVKIVDEFTGRILEGRRWSEGLHQAVEAKEGVKIKEENQTLATITLQNYFRLYEKLSGMTGTAVTEAAEFASTYELAVVPIPTNKPVIRADEGDLIYKTEEAKFEAVVGDISERYERGQPVLVGTVSVEKSERLSNLLRKKGVKHEVLNAKVGMLGGEAEIVAQAGKLHAVTVATNMAGRGVDIILGGNPEARARREALAEGLDPDDAGEGRARYDKLVDVYEIEGRAEGDKVRELGGLYVLGTERHESRRIDNQLRGRSGRQGDPGESRFYLSLEDDLMRLFATGAMNWVMGKALPDDVPIEAKMVTRAIEKAQTTVEARNAEIRKNVLKYDEVMNSQRKVIYRRRNEILEGKDLRDEAVANLEAAVNSVVDATCVSDIPDEWDVEGLVAAVNELYPTELIVEDLAAKAEVSELKEIILAEALRHYEAREAEFGPDAMRQVERQVMLRVIDTRWREHLFEMDYLQDGIHLRAMGQKDPLVEWQREGYAMFTDMVDAIAGDFVKYVMHLQAVKEPEAAPGADVRNMETSGPEAPESGGNGMRQAAAAEAQAQGVAPPPEAEVPVVNTPVVKGAEERVGRNAPCPCGSGKKYKFCHGR
ncbi:MAG: preprotein translocase subunit SecA [Acidimicrobiales bacterium]